MKHTSKLLILNSHNHIVGVYRAPGPWANPDSISLPGVDGPTIENVISQAWEKFGLSTTAEDWVHTGSAHNPANAEVNHLWQYRHLLDELPFRGRFIGGLYTYEARQYWDLRVQEPARISPALTSIMDSWAENEIVKKVFGAPPTVFGPTIKTDVFMGNMKLTTSAIIRTPDGMVWMVERADLAGINNPGLIAFPGANGDDLANHIAQLYRRIGVISGYDDWTPRPRIHNEANNEYKVPMLMIHPVEDMPRFRRGNHEAGKYARIGAYTLPELQSRAVNGGVSPAAVSVFNALSDKIFDGFKLAA